MNTVQLVTYIESNQQGPCSERGVAFPGGEVPLVFGTSEFCAQDSSQLWSRSCFEEIPQQDVPGPSFIWPEQVFERLVPQRHIQVDDFAGSEMSGYMNFPRSYEDSISTTPQCDLEVENWGSDDVHFFSDIGNTYLGFTDTDECRWGANFTKYRSDITTSDTFSSDLLHSILPQGLNSMPELEISEKDLTKSAHPYCDVASGCFSVSQQDDTSATCIGRATRRLKPLGEYHPSEAISVTNDLMVDRNLLTCGVKCCANDDGVYSTGIRMKVEGRPPQHSLLVQGQQQTTVASTSPSLALFAKDVTVAATSETDTKQRPPIFRIKRESLGENTVNLTPGDMMAEAPNLKPAEAFAGGSVHPSSAEDSAASRAGVVSENKLDALPTAGDASSQPTRSREDILFRYREKRRRRQFGRSVRYDLRKANADRRPRVKGRFVGRAKAAAMATEAAASAQQLFTA